MKKPEESYCRGFEYQTLQLEQQILFSEVKSLAKIV